MSRNRQEEIKTWFDQVYRSRGFAYLRPREAYYIFIDPLKPKTEENLLDIACGLGRLLEIGIEYGLEVHGIDISEVAVEHCRKHIPEANVIQANAESLPFDDQYFDYLTCIGSLERMIDMHKVLEEMERVSKPHARIIIMVRNKNSIAWGIKSLFGLKNEKGNQGAKSYQEWIRIFNAHHLRIVDTWVDTWMRLRLLRWITLGALKIKYKKPLSGILPFRFANEYIFLLEKE